MTEPTLNELTRRLERLERHGRRWKRATVTVLFGAVALVMMGQTPPHRASKSLEAEEFVLRDSRGQVRASLGTAQGSNSTVLQFHGENGKPRTRITVAGDVTSSFEVVNTNNQVGIQM